jgi:hypothetical protein
MKKDHRYKYEIGDLVGNPSYWPNSEWIVVGRGEDYIPPSGSRFSTVVIQHFPTEIITTRREDQLRQGKLPHLTLFFGRSGKHKKSYSNPLYASIRNHWLYIVKGQERTGINCHNYFGLPFQDEWNPDTNGSFAQAWWDIQSDIGPKPDLIDPRHIRTRTRAWATVRFNCRRSWIMRKRCLN